MLLTRSCVLDRIMELGLIRIEMIKSSESVINHYQNPHKMPLRGHLALQVYSTYLIKWDPIFEASVGQRHKWTPIFANSHF